MVSAAHEGEHRSHSFAPVRAGLAGRGVEFLGITSIWGEQRTRLGNPEQAPALVEHLVAFSRHHRGTTDQHPPQCHPSRAGGMLEGARGVVRKGRSCAGHGGDQVLEGVTAVSDHDHGPGVSQRRAEAHDHAGIEALGGPVAAGVAEVEVDRHLLRTGEEAHEPVVTHAGHVEPGGEGTRLALGSPGRSGRDDVQDERDVLFGCRRVVSVRRVHRDDLAASTSA